mgnify:FL=1
MNTHFFLYNARLSIYVPNNQVRWDLLSNDEQQNILLQWENIRGNIPDRIHDLENIINLKQEQLNKEEDFAVSCSLNTEISELASIINDLWLWYRTQQDVSVKTHF